MNNIEKFKQRRAKRLIARMDGTNSHRAFAKDDETEKESVGGGGGGNTRLPYGLAKGKGIDTEGMTPKEVWEALEGKGVSAKEEYAKLKERNKGQSESKGSTSMENFVKGCLQEPEGKRRNALVGAAKAIINTTKLGDTFTIGDRTFKRVGAKHEAFVSERNGHRAVYSQAEFISEFTESLLRGEQFKDTRPNVHRFKDSNAEQGSTPKSTTSASTKGGLAMPKIKKGSSLSEHVHVSEEMAEQDGFGDAFKKVVSKLTPKDYVYQKSPDGTVTASVPCLDAKFDNRVVFKGKAKSAGVQKIYDDLVKKGTAITGDMLSIAKGCGASLDGIEHSIKAGSHFAEKIDRARKKKKYPDSVSDEQIANSLTDSVRFTMMSNHNDLVKNTKVLMKELESKGYEIVECENKYMPEDDEPIKYKGVHLGVKSPDGVVFEVQIHSKESMDVKMKNHKLYEKIEGKDGNTYSDEEIEKMNQQMIDNAAKLKDPDGIADIKTFKK